MVIFPIQDEEVNLRGNRILEIFGTSVTFPIPHEGFRIQDEGKTRSTGYKVRKRHLELFEKYGLYAPIFPLVSFYQLTYRINGSGPHRVGPERVENPRRP